MIYAIMIILASLLNRLGGLGEGGHRDRFPNMPKWMFRSYMRDWGMPVLFTLWCWYDGIIMNWWILLACVLYGVSLTTYLKKKRGSAVQAKHWIGSGLCKGLAMFPLIMCGIDMDRMLIRIAVVVVGTLIFGLIPNDDISELGRGAVDFSSLLIL